MNAFPRERIFAKDKNDRQDERVLCWNETRLLERKVNLKEKTPWNYKRLNHER